jgi:hypothetical protein
MQPDWPVLSWYWPATQLMQASDDIELVAGLYVPAAHEMQALDETEPVAGLYMPVPQP